MKFFKNKKGFTLVELVVVIAILGILAGIAIPRFMDATASARGAKIVADLRTIDSAIMMYYAKNGGTTVPTIDDLQGGYLAGTPKPPTGTALINNSAGTAISWTITSTNYAIIDSFDTTSEGVTTTTDFGTARATIGNKTVDNLVAATTGGSL